MRLHRTTLPLLLTFSLLSVVPTAEGQPQDPARIFFTGGIGAPSGPRSFYDFWKPGIAIGGGIRWAWQPTYYYGIEGEVSFYSLDQDRYLKALKLPSGTATVEGGSSTLISVSGIVGSTTINPEETFRVSGDLGAGLLMSMLSTTSGTFSGFTRESPGVSYGAFFLSAAGRMELTTLGPWRMALEGKYRLGIMGNKAANTDYSSLRLYLSRPLSAP